MVVYCPVCWSEDIKIDVIGEVPPKDAISMNELGKVRITMILGVKSIRYRAECQNCGYTVEFESQEFI